MLAKTIQSIKKIAEQTDRIILFHSGAGKDSIALLNLCYPHFKEITCVYMYIVKDLVHIKKYINWAITKYPGVKFLEVPHYALTSYIRTGYKGIKKDPKQKILSLADINERVRLKAGTEWTIYGFKQSDSMNRCLMLRTYENSIINSPTKKAYPLSEWKNNDVLKYIKMNRLITPIKYGTAKSQGTAIDDKDFVLWCYKNYSQDYKQIIKTFPEAEVIVFEHLNRRK